MAIAVTYLERSPEGPRNVLTLFDARGRAALTYAKVHTCSFDLPEEALGAGRGVPGGPAGDALPARSPSGSHDLLRPRVPGGRPGAGARRRRAASSCPTPASSRRTGSARSGRARSRTWSPWPWPTTRRRRQAGAAEENGHSTVVDPDRLRRGRSQPRHARLRGRRGGGGLRGPPRPRRAARRGAAGRCGGRSAGGPETYGVLLEARRRPGSPAPRRTGQPRPGAVAGLPRTRARGRLGRPLARVLLHRRPAGAAALSRRSCPRRPCRCPATWPSRRSSRRSSRRGPRGAPPWGRGRRTRRRGSPRRRAARCRRC